MNRLGYAIGQLAGLVRRFAKSGEATAAIEFAAVMPVMLLMYLGSLELSDAISVDQRVTNVAGTVGDLVARENGEITATDLSDYFQAATAILSPFPTTTLTQVVTLVAVSNTGVTTVKWSQPYNGGTAKTVGQAYPATNAIPAAMLNISHNNYIIVSEASYSYKPLLGWFFKNSFNLYHQNFYLPRYAKIICYDTATCS
ncbi:MAG: pilus assembly protein [Devosia sp.]|nr:pilus assembly protein [Devosia sp.]